MRNLTATICLGVALLLGSTGESWSQNFQKGLSAYNSGDYATALREWIPLAIQGNAFAQNNLGVMYANGEGVPQDYKTAVKLYRLAAEQVFCRIVSVLICGSTLPHHLGTRSHLKLETLLRKR